MNRDPVILEIFDLEGETSIINGPGTSIFRDSVTYTNFEKIDIEIGELFYAKNTYSAKIVPKSGTWKAAWVGLYNVETTDIDLTTIPGTYLAAVLVDTPMIFNFAANKPGDYEIRVSVTDLYPFSVTRARITVLPECDDESSSPIEIFVPATCYSGERFTYTIKATDLHWTQAFCGIFDPITPDIDLTTKRGYLTEVRDGPFSQEIKIEEIGEYEIRFVISDTFPFNVFKKRIVVESLQRESEHVVIDIPEVISVDTKYEAIVNPETLPRSGMIWGGVFNPTSSDDQLLTVPGSMLTQLTPGEISKFPFSLSKIGEYEIRVVVTDTWPFDISRRKFKVTEKVEDIGTALPKEDFTFENWIDFFFQCVSDDQYIEEYARIMTQNDIPVEFCADLDFPFLKNMGIKTPKHQLEIMHLVNKIKRSLLTMEILTSVNK